MPTPTVSDLFNRANSAGGLGTADTGQAWSALISTMQILTSRGCSTSAARSAAVIDVGTGGGNSTIEANVGSGAAQGGYALYFRASDVNNWWRLSVNAGSYQYTSGSHQESYWTEGYWYYDGTYTVSAWGAEVYQGTYTPGSPYYTPGRYWENYHAPTGLYLTEIRTTSPEHWGYAKYRTATENQAWSPGYWTYYTVTDTATAYPWNLLLEKCVAGAITRVSTVSQGAAPTHLKVVANGSTIEAWTSTLQVTITDAFNATATKHGIGYGESGSIAPATSSYGNTDGLDDFTILVANLAPNVSTGLSPLNAAVLDCSQPKRFSWVFSDADVNDTQIRFDLQYRLVGAPSWTPVTMLTANNYWDAPSYTFGNGIYEWRVQTYDNAGATSPYTAPIQFNSSDPNIFAVPGIASGFAPTGTTITGAGTVDGAIGIARAYAGVGSAMSAVLISGIAGAAQAIAPSVFRANLCSNPSFEEGMTDWGTHEAIIEPTTFEYHSGTTSLKVTIAAGYMPGALTVSTIFCNEAVPYIASSWIKGPVGANIGMFQTTWNAAGTFIGDYNTMYTMTGNWQRISHTRIATVGDTVRVAVRSLEAVDRIFYIDDIMFEKSSIVNDYFDGNSPGAIWTGVPNASTSTLNESLTQPSAGYYFDESVSAGALALAGNQVDIFWNGLTAKPGIAYGVAVPAIILVLPASLVPVYSVLDYRKRFLDPQVSITRRVEILEADGTTLWDDKFGNKKRLISGSVSVDYTRDERRSCDLELANFDGALVHKPDGFWYDKVLRLFRGIEFYDESGLRSYEVTLGTFMIDRVTQARFPKTVKITARDYTKKCMLSKFGQATGFTAGTEIETVIAALASNAGVHDRIFPVTGKVLGVDTFFERDSSRWDAMKQIAEAFGYELFFNAQGFLVMRSFIDPTLGAISHEFKTGPSTGNLVDWEKSTNDTRIFNHISVSGSDQTTSPVWAESMNNNSISPTRIAKLGDRVYSYDSAFVTTTQQAQDLADSYLKIYGLEEFDVNLTSVPAPWLEAGEIIRFTDPDTPTGDPDRFLMTSFTIPMTLEPMTAVGRRVMIVS